MEGHQNPIIPPKIQIYNPNDYLPIAEATQPADHNEQPLKELSSTALLIPPEKKRRFNSSRTMARRKSISSGSKTSEESSHNVDNVNFRTKGETPAYSVSRTQCLTSNDDLQVEFPTPKHFHAYTKVKLPEMENIRTYGSMQHEIWTVGRNFKHPIRRLRKDTLELSPNQCHRILADSTCDSALEMKLVKMKEALRGHPPSKRLKLDILADTESSSTPKINISRRSATKLSPIEEKRVKNNDSWDLLFHKGSVTKRNENGTGNETSSSESEDEMRAFGDEDENIFDCIQTFPKSTNSHTKKKSRSSRQTVHIPKVNIGRAVSLFFSRFRKVGVSPEVLAENKSTSDKHFSSKNVSASFSFKAILRKIKGFNNTDMVSYQHISKQSLHDSYTEIQDEKRTLHSESCKDNVENEKGVGVENCDVSLQNLDSISKFGFDETSGQQISPENQKITNDDEENQNYLSASSESLRPVTQAMHAHRMPSDCLHNNENKVMPQDVLLSLKSSESQNSQSSAAKPMIMITRKSEENREISYEDSKVSPQEPTNHLIHAEPNVTIREGKDERMKKESFLGTLFSFFHRKNAVPLHKNYDPEPDLVQVTEKKGLLQKLGLRSKKTEPPVVSLTKALISAHILADTSVDQNLVSEAEDIPIKSKHVDSVSIIRQRRLKWFEEAQGFFQDSVMAYNNGPRVKQMAGTVPFAAPFSPPSPSLNTSNRLVEAVGLCPPSIVLASDPYSLQGFGYKSSVSESVILPAISRRKRRLNQNFLLDEAPKDKDDSALKDNQGHKQVKKGILKNV